MPLLDIHDDAEIGCAACGRGLKTPCALCRLLLRRRRSTDDGSRDEGRRHTKASATNSGNAPLRKKSVKVGVCVLMAPGMAPGLSCACVCVVGCKPRAGRRQCKPLSLKGVGRRGGLVVAALSDALTRQPRTIPTRWQASRRLCDRGVSVKMCLWIRSCIAMVVVLVVPMV